MKPKHISFIKKIGELKMYLSQFLIQKNNLLYDTDMVKHVKHLVYIFIHKLTPTTVE
jgi:hypothetical protein